MDKDFIVWKERCHSLFMDVFYNGYLKDKKIIFDPGIDWLYKMFQQGTTSQEVVDQYIAWYC